MFVRHKPTCEKDNTIKFKIKSTDLVLWGPVYYCVYVCVFVCVGVLFFGGKNQ